MDGRHRRHILEVLQADGRITNQELADRIGLSPSPTLRRVRILEQNGVISGYGAVVDPASLGLGVLAVIEVTLSDHLTARVEATEQAFRESPTIVEAHMIAGDGDYLLTVGCAISPTSSGPSSRSCGRSATSPRSARSSRSGR